MDQRPTGVVADAAEYRGADARRPDDGMRVPPDWVQRVFKLEQGRAWQADDLLPVPNQVDLGNAESADDDDLAVVGVSVWSRAAREPRVRRLHEDYLARLGTGSQAPPHLYE